MFPAHLGEEVSNRAAAPGFYIFMTPADTFHGVLKILAFPFQIDSQSFIECDGRVLAMPLGVFFQLRLAFRLEGNRIHIASVRGG